MKPIVLAVLALGALAGCKDTPEVTAVDTETGPLTSSQASIDANAGRGRGIEALKGAWDAAWAAKDAAAYAAITRWTPTS